MKSARWASGRRRLAQVKLSRECASAAASMTQGETLRPFASTSVRRHLIARFGRDCSLALDPRGPKSKAPADHEKRLALLERRAESLKARKVPKTEPAAKEANQRDLESVKKMIRGERQWARWSLKWDAWATRINVRGRDKARDEKPMTAMGETLMTEKNRPPKY